MKTGGGILAAAALAMASAYADDVSISATAANAISVDSRSGEVRTVAPCAIGYSPTWCGVTNEDAHVVLYKVEHAGMFNAVTNEVMTFSAGAEDDYSYSPAADGAKCVQLIHRVFTSGDEEIGTPLVRDVSFGFAATAGDTAAVDSRDGLLQRVADVNGTAGFTYDTAWATNTRSVVISAVQTKDENGNEIAMPTTNVLFSVFEHTEVEYIQGNGSNGRIVTDYTPNPQTDKIEAVIEWPSGTLTTGENHAIWCARGSTATTKTYTLFAIGTNLRFDYNSAVNGAISPALATGTRYTVTAEGNVFSRSGGNGYTYTAVSGFTAAGGPLVLFASYYNGVNNNLGNYGKHKLYSFKVWRSGVLLYDLVPAVRVSDSQVGLYDKVSGSKFYPVTGSFTTDDSVGSSCIFYKTLKSGGWRYLLTLLDSEGEALGDPLSADYFKKGAGFFLIVR